MPSGKKPKHHVTMTATTSLWRIFRVINDCKAQSNCVGVIDGDIKMWDMLSQVVTVHTLFQHFTVRKANMRTLRPYKATKFPLSAIWPSLQWLICICIYVNTETEMICYCPAISCWFQKRINASASAAALGPSSPRAQDAGPLHASVAVIRADAWAEQSNSFQTT